ncbi:MAG: phytanoyl-CoA dioxygenase family protein [Hormoscilla sp.]
MESTCYSQTIEQYGFSIVPGVLDKHQVAALRYEVQLALGRSYAMRRILELVPGVSQLCEETALRALVEPIIGDRAFPVRGIFFDKNPEANWGVSWHQDLTIAVNQRIDTDGFGPWSIKEGVDHVQPPVRILEKMLTLRIHLDDADAENGALRLIPGSHNRGILPRETIANLKKHAITTTVKSGGVLVMKPLLVHSSLPAGKPSHRRVQHNRICC